MANLIVFIIIALIVTASIRKIVIEKKNGAKCIGCPSSGKSNCNSNFK